MNSIMLFSINISNSNFQSLFQHCNILETIDHSNSVPRLFKAVRKKQNITRQIHGVFLYVFLHNKIQSRKSEHSCNLRKKIGVSLNSFYNREKKWIEECIFSCIWKNNKEGLGTKMAPSPLNFAILPHSYNFSTTTFHFQVTGRIFFSWIRCLLPLALIQIKTLIVCEKCYYYKTTQSASRDGILLSIF